MGQDLGTAVALLLVLEGIMPFLSPVTLRRALLAVLEMDDRALRVSGLASMIAGVLLLQFLH